MSSEIRNSSIQDLKRRFRTGNPFPTGIEWAELKSDPRRGVRDLAFQLERTQERAAAEKVRLGECLRHESEARAKGHQYIGGVDEAGVGPLAGPVVAAAVIMPVEPLLHGVDDSKKLGEKKRYELAERVKKTAIAYAIGSASVEEIDRVNIYQAGLIAMRRAVAGLQQQPDFLLVDARTIPQLEIPQIGLKHGDRLSYSIAAASILAKTHRDELMANLATAYPGYGFATHKGYPTVNHRKAILKLGLTPAHRRTFASLPEPSKSHPTLF